jgi:hypothetical protein
MSLLMTFYWYHSLELVFLYNLWGLGTENRKRVIVPARRATLSSGIDSLESIPGLHKRLKIRAQLILSGRSVPLNENTAKN